MITKTIKETVDFLEDNPGLIKHKINIDVIVPFPYKGESSFFIEDKLVMRIRGSKQEILKLFSNKLK